LTQDYICTTVKITYVIFHGSASPNMPKPGNRKEATGAGGYRTDRATGETFIILSKGGVMESCAKSMTGFSLSVFFAIIATASLFAALPLLTQLQYTTDNRPDIAPVFIDTLRPAPPPPETREEAKIQTPPESRMVEKKDLSRRLQPKIDILNGTGITMGDAWIDIGIPKVTTDLFPVSDPAYTPAEVDQIPRLLRSFPPQYPYLAKRDNIEGWVVLRFMVGTEGAADRVAVVAAEPEDVFEEAALKAVARYKFQPAMKGGEAVNCVVQQKIHFSLD
jgi:TonB family protein